MQCMQAAKRIANIHAVHASSEADCEYPFGLVENSGKGGILWRK